MDSEKILGMIGFGLSIIGIIIAAINHTRIRSNCFGRRLEFSVDIEKTTPVLSSKPSAFEIKLPESPMAVAKTSCGKRDKEEVEIN